MTRGEPFAQRFLAESAEVIRRLDAESIEQAAEMLAETRIAGGRLFILGVGGSAANAARASQASRVPVSEGKQCQPPSFFWAEISQASARCTRESSE
jgi:hypothetical protein